MERLVIKVVEVRGKCPIYKLGDRIVIEWTNCKVR